MGVKGLKTGDLKFIQEWNRFLILNIIRKEGPISRIEIAKRIDLSPTTVTTAVSDMIREGLVAEAGPGTSSGGRKPILLRFMPDSKCLIAVAIRSSSISIARMNLNAEIKREKHYLTGGRKGEEFLQYVIEKIEEFLGDEENLDHCIGLSVSCPGIVDSQRGDIRYNSKLELENIPFTQMLEERFGLKTWLENDANAMALAEMIFGIYRQSEHIVYVTVGDGVGAGIIANGELFSGYGGGAGEFGHISVVPDGLPCECGNIGCLENYAAWPAIQKRLVQKLSDDRPSLLKERNLTIRNFLSAIDHGDEVATDVALEISEYLAKGLVSLINLFNPEVVIIGGDLFLDHSYLLNQVTCLTRRSIMNVFTDDIIIDGASFGYEQHLVGAASILLYDQFRFSLLA